MAAVHLRWRFSLGPIVALALLVAACSSAPGDSNAATVDGDVDASEPTESPQEADADAAADEDSVVPTETGTAGTGSVAPTVPPTTAPLAQPSPTATPEPRPPAPNGRAAPRVASTPTQLADQVAAAEAGLQVAGATPVELADWGHLHQVAIRKLGYEPGWDTEFFDALPPEYRDRTMLHLAARRALIDLSSGYSAADFIPAWQIIEPEPADALLGYYQEAEAATGIEWEYLAAINLIETGMGRIRGLSSAGAQGPMQFLPTTWAEAGIGEGDIDDPRDAINAAARYLVRRGGPSDMAGALWGYNNSDDYVTAVLSYAELLRQDPAAYAAIYNWEIYFYTEAGDVWLPAGFITPERVDLVDFLAANPWSAPDAGLR